MERPDSAGFRYVSEDLIIEILLPLPIKSLLKFRCVSKSWRSLISSKRFVQAHLNFSENNIDYVSVLSKKITKESYTIQFEQYPLINAMNKSDDDRAAEFYFPLSNEATSFKFIGSYKGLCCALIETCKCESRRLFVWNPSTRKSRQLPFFTNVSYVVEGLGFGFDGDDYKVLAMYNELHSGRKVAKLYSSRIDTWKIVEVKNLLPGDEGYQKNLLPGDEGYPSFGKFSNGKLYWMTENKQVWYFDLGTEAHGTLEPPQSACKDGKLITTLQVVGKRLCLTCHMRCPFRVEMWILKQHGLKDESWSKMISILTADCYYREPIWMTGNGKILLCSTFELIIYDPKSNLISNMNRSALRLYTSCVYATSLVSPFQEDCDLIEG